MCAQIVEFPEELSGLDLGCLPIDRRCLGLSVNDCLRFSMELSRKLRNECLNGGGQRLGVGKLDPILFLLLL